jgi:hypothetical protein
MPGYDGTGLRSSGANWEPQRSHSRELANARTSVENHFEDESGGWCHRVRGGKPTGRATEDSAALGAESFRRGQIEALLMAELDRLRNMLSEYLESDANRLTAELDGLKRMLLKRLRGEGDDNHRIGDRTQSQLRRAGK